MANSIGGQENTHSVLKYKIKLGISMSRCAVFKYDSSVLDFVLQSQAVHVVNDNELLYPLFLWVKA